MHDGRALLQAQRIALETWVCDDMMDTVSSHAVTWKLASDKIAFKVRLMQAGLPTPKMWIAPENATQDYVVKHSIGSTSRELAGPFKAGTLPDRAAFNRLVASNEQGSTYVEAFVAGTSIKVWFWGEHAFFAQNSCANGEENVMLEMTSGQREQIDRIGYALALDLQHEFGTPVLYSLDAIVDDEGQIWWLEMHSEPVLPAAGYLPILASLAKTQIPNFLTSLATMANTSSSSSTSCDTVPPLDETKHSLR